MTHNPNVYGYVNGKPVFSRDEFIFEHRKRGPIEDDAELIAFAEKATSGWHNAGWSHSFISFYLSDYALSEPFASLTLTFRTQQLATYAPPKQVEVTKHLGDEGVDATDKVVTVSLTQADTLLLGSLSPDEDQQVEVQIRGRTEDGRAFASNIMTAPLSRILKDGVI